MNYLDCEGNIAVIKMLRCPPILMELRHILFILRAKM